MELPRLVVFYGLIASGKSTLGKMFAAKHAYLHLNTDRVRKELVGVAATEHQPAGHAQGIYTAEITARTYAELLLRAERALQNGAPGVVLDGSYSLPVQRSGVRGLAKSLGERVVFIFCDCSRATVQARLLQRAQDPLAVSDGSWDIYLQQLATTEPALELPAGERLQLTTEKPPAELLLELERGLLLDESE